MDTHTIIGDAKHWDVFALVGCASHGHRACPQADDVVTQWQYALHRLCAARDACHNVTIASVTGAAIWDGSITGVAALADAIATVIRWTTDTPADPPGALVVLSKGITHRHTAQHWCPTRQQVAAVLQWLHHTLQHHYDPCDELREVIVARASGVILWRETFDKITDIPLVVDYVGFGGRVVAR